jgi:hypothetical protein
MPTNATMSWSWLTICDGFAVRDTRMIYESTKRGLRKFDCEVSSMMSII